MGLAEIIPVVLPSLEPPPLDEICSEPTKRAQVLTLNRGFDVDGRQRHLTFITRSIGPATRLAPRQRWDTQLFDQKVICIAQTISTKRGVSS